MQANVQNDALEDEEPVIITFHDEEGNDIALELLDLIEHKGDKYSVLLPVEENDEAGDVLIFKIEAMQDSEDEDMYVALEDEDLEIEIFEIFKERFKDEFNFVD